MRILAIEREVPGVTDEAIRPHLMEEAARVWELYQAGVFRELYFRQDSRALYCCSSVQILKRLGKSSIHYRW